MKKLSEVLHFLIGLQKSEGDLETNVVSIGLSSKDTGWVVKFKTETPLAYRISHSRPIQPEAPKGSYTR